MFSLFGHDAPVTRHSPAIFDAFVNQTKVNSHPAALDRILKGVLSSGESAFMLKTKP